ncbi:hypothetical protein CLOM_g22141 [Closterium sp. NIES-68]|nr:hypothetical protein CLOM_g22141 [Closterium sp. NIES-68]GJP74495.1 hypothetical protein CLOP_g5065 [Closterium sp. NIES-67]
MEDATLDEPSLRAAAQANPADDAALAGLARLALARHQWSDAVDVLRAAVSARPDESEYHLLLGEALWNSAEEGAVVAAKQAGGGEEGGGSEARAAGRAASYAEWLQAGKLSPSSADAFRCLGYFFGSFQGVIPRRDARGAQQADGRHAEAWWAAGERKRVLKGGAGGEEGLVRDVGRAIKCFQKAVSVNPGDHDAGEAAFHLLAGGRASPRQRSLQVALCRAAVEGSVRAFWAWRLLGLLHAEEGSWQDAVPCLQSAIKGFVLDAACWRALALCYQRLGRHSAALKAYGRVITLGLPQVASAITALVPASVAAAAASPGAAERSSSDTPCAVFALEQSGHIELERSNYSKALEFFSYAHAQRAGSATVQWGMAAARYGMACHVASFGAAAWANDLLQAAAASAHASISRHPTSATTWKLLGDIELRHSSVLLATPPSSPTPSTAPPPSYSRASLLAWRRHRFRLASSALRSYAHALHLSPHPSACPSADSPHLSPFLRVGMPEVGLMGEGAKGTGGKGGGRLWADLTLAAAAKARSWAELVEAGGGGEEEVECGSAGDDGEDKAEVLDAASVKELSALPPRLLLPALQSQQGAAGAHAWVVLAAVVGWQWPEVQQHALVHALMLHPLDALAWVLLGEVYLHQNQPNLAAQAFARARVADPFIAAPWVASAARQLRWLIAAPAVTVADSSAPDVGTDSTAGTVGADGDGDSSPSLHAAMADAFFAATACSNPPACAQHVLGQLSGRCGRLGQAEVFCALSHLASSSPASPEALFLHGLSASARRLPSVALPAFRSAKHMLLLHQGPAERVWLASVHVGMALTAAHQFSEAVVEFDSAHALRDRSTWPVRPLLALSLALHHCMRQDDALSMVALATTQATHLVASPSPSPSATSHSLLPAAAVRLHAALLASPPALPSSPSPPTSLAPSLFHSPSLARDLALTRVDVSLTALAAAAASLDDGEIGRAVQQYRPVFGDPHMAPRAHALLGVSLAAKGQLSRALKYLTRSLHHIPDSLLLRSCLADLLSPSHPARAARIIAMAPSALSIHPPPPPLAQLTAAAPPDCSGAGSAAWGVVVSVVRVQASTQLACSACASGMAHGAGACTRTAPFPTVAAGPSSSGSSSSIGERGAVEAHVSRQSQLRLLARAIHTRPSDPTLRLLLLRLSLSPSSHVSPFGAPLPPPSSLSTSLLRFSHSLLALIHTSFPSDSPSIPSTPSAPSASSPSLSLFHLASEKAPAATPPLMQELWVHALLSASECAARCQSVPTSTLDGSQPAHSLTYLALSLASHALSECLLLPNSPPSASQKAALRACAECQVVRCKSLQETPAGASSPFPVSSSFPPSLLPSLASASSLFCSGFSHEAEAVVAALQADGMQGGQGQHGQEESRLLIGSAVQMWQAVIGAEKGELSKARTILEGLVGSLKEAAAAGGMAGAAVQPMLDVAHVLLGSVLLSLHHSNPSDSSLPLAARRSLLSVTSPSSSIFPHLHLLLSSADSLAASRSAAPRKRAAHLQQEWAAWPSVCRPARVLAALGEALAGLEAGGGAPETGGGAAGDGGGGGGGEPKDKSEGEAEREKMGSGACGARSPLGLVQAAVHVDPSCRHHWEVLRHLSQGSSGKAVRG